MRNVIIVLCYNDNSVALKYLQKIVKFKSIDKIIVVDNASKVEIFETLKFGIAEFNKSRKIDIISNKKNYGYAIGNNRGIKYAYEKYHPQYITISNTDIEYEDSVLEAVLGFCDNKKNVGMVSPTMCTPNDGNTLTAWKLPSFPMAMWNANFALKKLYNPQGYSDNYFNREYSNVDVLPGSFFTCPAKILIAVNGFDEDTFLYGEESLLAYKLIKYGCVNYLLNNEKYMHYHSMIINKNIDYSKKFELLYEANSIYNKKCLNTGFLRNTLYRWWYCIGKKIFMLYTYGRKKI